MVNGGFLSLMLSVGHRTGLFDTLATLEPATSDRIAAAAGLNQRYVREGLGACWGEEKARELLAEAGFTSVEASRVEGDQLNAYYVCRA